MKTCLLLLPLLCLAAALARTISRDEERGPEDAADFSPEVVARVEELLARHPVFDGHNDLPMALRGLYNNTLDEVELDRDLTGVEPWNSWHANHIDLPRARKGRLGAQFWAAYVGCDTQHKDAVRQFLEQVDVIKRMVEKYPDDLMWADSTQDVESAMHLGKIASLVGVESGHAISSSLAILRILYNEGAR